MRYPRELILVWCAAGILSHADTSAPRTGIADSSLSAAIELRQSRADDVQVGVYYFPLWHRQPVDAEEPYGEWKSIRSAIPRFEGHAQPKVPLWGYEDEADPKVMARKIDAAADAGVDVFIFDWYYHSKGAFRGTYLESALNDGYLKAPNSDRIRFALMWANHGLGVDSPGGVGRDEFTTLSLRLVKDYFTHPNYWKIDGRAYFSIYEVRTFINGLGGEAQALAAMRDLDEAARGAGLNGVHFNAIESQVRSTPPIDLALIRRVGFHSVTSYVWVHVVGFSDKPPHTDYEHFRENYFRIYDAEKQNYGLPYFPNVTMGWDPTPRLKPGQVYDASGQYPNTQVISGNTPAGFKRALEQARQRASSLPEGQRVITINAWNEWGEGSYLEPDTVNKTGYLDAMKAVFREAE